MINALLITNTLEESPSGGRQLLRKLNHDALKEIYGEGFIPYQLMRSRLLGVKSTLNAVKNNGSNLTLIYWDKLLLKYNMTFLKISLFTNNQDSISNIEKLKKYSKITMSFHKNSLRIILIGLICRLL
jgi:hypothetical protein